MTAALCVVAGAAGAIGSAVTRRLLDRGQTVIGVGRDTDRLAAVVAHDRLEKCEADLTDDAAVAAIATAVADRPVAMVVNATRPAAAGSVKEIAPSTVAAAVELKVSGLLRLVRATEHSLLPGGRIIAIGGRLGYDPDPETAAAGIANAAVANLVRQLALAYGPRGVTAHVVAPGAVDSPRMRAENPGGSLERLAAHSPLGRLPTVDDVTWAVLMLAEPGADHLNGGSLLLDGGRRSAIP
jgi:NAD(P)-dependent dehydrogenase (short-subunit alcohol dehydrogenase family)